jgi:adenylylsulfate kinase
MSEPVEVVWHRHHVTREQREQLNGHPGFVVWFTGLSGSGKSTVANLVDQRLHEMKVHSFLLDGDNVRHGLNASPEMLAQHGPPFASRFGLGFAPMDREENIRRVGAVAELFASAGLVTLVAFVSPYRADRDAARKRLETARPGSFVEVWVDAPLEICQQRDPKGLYAKARAGQIPEFTGVSAPYEEPRHAEIHLQAGRAPPHQLAEEVIDYLRRTNKLPGVTHVGP